MCANEREFQTLSLLRSRKKERERGREREREKKRRKKREREDRFRSSPSIPLTCSHECIHTPKRTVHMRYIHRFSRHNN